jgi:hypothetical protein
MAVKLLNPGELNTPTRSAAFVAGSQILSGRFMAINSAGQAVAPGAGAKTGLYLVLSGSHEHTGAPDAFGASPFASTAAVESPMAKASNQAALAFGTFRYSVGSEGCDPTETFAVGDLVAIDAFGRLIPVGAGVAVGRVESVTVVGGLVTQLVVLKFGN